MRRGSKRFTDVWLPRMVMPLFIKFPMGTRLSVGPYTSTIDTTPLFSPSAQGRAVAAPACSSSLPVVDGTALPEALAPTVSMHTAAPIQSVVFLINSTGSSSDLKLYAPHWA